MNQKALIIGGDKRQEYLKIIIENQFEVKDDQKDERDKFFRYNDNNNCKRIYECILSKTDK